MSKAAALGLDPGTAKCGLVVVTGEGEVLYRAVTDLATLPTVLSEVTGRFGLLPVALGSSTGAEAVERIVQQVLPGVDIARVEEHHTTEEARRLYWRYCPPRGWRRVVPRGMLLPPEPLDAYAAEVLVKRWLASIRRPAAL